MKPRHVLRFAVASAAVLLGCRSATDAPVGLPRNNNLSIEWPEASPDEQGFDAAMLGIAYTIARSQPHLKSLLVLRNGYLVAEEYFAQDDDTTIAEVRAVTSSFMSSLVGIAIDEGHIDNVDQSIADYLVPDVVASLDDAHRANTIRHLLQMTSGLQWAEGSQAEADGFAASGLTELWRYALSKPMALAPGNRLVYNSGAISLLSVILTAATGVSTLDYARQKLLGPLGIDSLAWIKDGDYWYAASGMRMRPRDMAKLGVLYLNGGESAGQSIVPAPWVQQATTPVVANGVPYNYAPISSMNHGYLWWVFPHPLTSAFFAWGFGGQFIYCVPSLDLVVVTTVDASQLTYDTKGAVEKAVLELIIDRVLPAVVR
jgi:CubicO group peptidase (beta-lactamase class C family)